MRIILLFCLILFISISSFPQDYKNVYYNRNWEITSVKYASFYRNSGFNMDKMAFDSIVNDYYISDAPEMTGFYSNGVKHGEFVYYFPNGQIFLKSEYRNNTRHGTWIEYFKNGIIKREVKYDHNKEYLVRYNDSLGISLLKDNSCRYQLKYFINDYFNSNEKYRIPKATDSYELSGKIKNGLKEGSWIIKKNNKKYSEINYKNGSFVNGYIVLGDSKVSISYDEMTPLISEPVKLSITEGVFLEEGQIIKNNYLLEAIEMNKRKNQKKVILENKEEFIAYFNNSFTKFNTNCADTVYIFIKARIDNHGIIEILPFNASLNKSYQNEVDRIIHTISHINQFHNSEFDFNYRVLCVDELELEFEK